MATCRECQRESPGGALYCAFCGAALEGSQPRAAPGEARVGATVAGRYFLERLVGSGGMGDVYRAADLAAERTVAVKLLRPGASGDEVARARFEREARAASLLRHPAVVEVLDFGSTAEGVGYLAMELVEGSTLSRLLAEQGPLPEGRVVRIAAQMLEALAAAHEAGVVHRDLKPANVMVVPGPDGDERVKVLDFGIAKLAPGQVADTLTQQGLVHGTPAYMSPEQVRGEPLDARSDLYAVGALLYELLSGAPPFEAPTPMAIAARHLTDSPPPLSARRAGVTPALEALVLRALAKDPAARPASAAAMREALLASGAPGWAVPPAGPAPEPPTEALRRFGPAPTPARRSRRPVAAAALPALALAAFLAWRWRGAEPAPPAAVAPPAPAPAASAPAPPAPAPAAVLPEALPAAPSSEEQPRPRPAAAAAAPARPRRAEPAPRPARAARQVSAELGTIPTPLASSGDGLLVLEASPWAEVSLDGEPLGETPREVRLPAGTYTVRAVHPELGAREARVRVAAGERRLWAATFGP